MMKIIVFLVTVTPLFLLNSSVVRSEMSRGFIPSGGYTDSRSVFRDLKIDAKNDIPELFEQRYAVTETAEADSVYKDINGFRVQVFMSEDINEAKIRESMYVDNYGEDNVLLIFERPFYRIRIGKFRTRPEALEFQESLTQRGIYRTIIVPDVIRVKMPLNE